jgi:hypothetical protein
VATNGLIVLEFSKKTDSLGEVIERAIDVIEDENDLVKGNHPRDIQHILIVEELGDAWAGKRAKAQDRSKKLQRFLEKAWRKGWCVWLSTQRISELGPDEESARETLELVKNLIVHGVTAKEEAVLLDILRDEDHATSDIQYVQQQIRNRVQGVAMVRAVARDGKDARPLPPVYIAVPKLQNLTAAETESEASLSS